MQEFNTIYKKKSVLVDCTNKLDMNLKDFLESHGSELENFNITNAKNLKNIAVLGAGMSAEREVSFMSSNGIVNSLLELGHHVIFIDMGADIANVLEKLKPRVVFNALHGTYGEDGCLPGLLNILRIPYTGPGVLSSSLAFNKKKSHEIFQANGIKVAKAITVSKHDNLKTDPMPKPYVIKPLSQGSSVGVHVVFKEDNFSFPDYEFKYGDEILVEQYIKGREMQVAVLNGKAMGVLEIELLKGKRFYDYEVKYTHGYANHLLPAPISDKARKKVMTISEQACRIFDCISGIIRVEFIYNEQEDDFYILELNTHPGMTPLSICPEIVATQDINYTSLVEKILDSAHFE
jgi:D-alanine-D-alanine ligase